MAITIELAPEVEARLRREAEARGVAVDRYAASLLEEKVEVSSSPGPSTLSNEEWFSRLKAFMGSMRDTPYLSPES